MIAIGNGEPCPFCLKEQGIDSSQFKSLHRIMRDETHPLYTEKRKRYNKVFINQPDNDFLQHLMDKHPSQMEKALFGGEDVGI